MNDTERVQRVVVGVDGSPASLRALRFAADEARRREVPLVAVHAWGAPDRMLVASYGGPLLNEDRFVQAATQVVHEALDSELGDQRAALDIRVEAPEGSAPAALLAAAGQDGLLVVGSRGHGGFRGLLLGSVSLHCVTHARCPVLVVHAHSVEVAEHPVTAAERPADETGEGLHELDHARREASASFL